MLKSFGFLFVIDHNGEMKKFLFSFLGAERYKKTVTVNKEKISLNIW